MNSFPIAIVVRVMSNSDVFGNKSNKIMLIPNFFVNRDFIVGIIGLSKTKSDFIKALFLDWDIFCL